MTSRRTSAAASDVLRTARMLGDGGDALELGPNAGRG
jgi:hypothetical protein